MGFQRLFSQKANSPPGFKVRRPDPWLRPDARAGCDGRHRCRTPDPHSQARGCPHHRLKRAPRPGHILRGALHRGCRGIIADVAFNPQTSLQKRGSGARATAKVQAGCRLHAQFSKPLAQPADATFGKVILRFSGQIQPTLEGFIVVRRIGVNSAGGVESGMRNLPNLGRGFLNDNLNQGLIGNCLCLEPFDTHNALVLHE